MPNNLHRVFLYEKLFVELMNPPLAVSVCFQTAATMIQDGRESEAREAITRAHTLLMETNANYRIFQYKHNKLTPSLLWDNPLGVFLGLCAVPYIS